MCCHSVRTYLCVSRILLHINMYVFLQVACSYICTYFLMNVYVSIWYRLTQASESCIYVLFCLLCTKYVCNACTQTYIRVCISTNMCYVQYILQTLLSMYICRYVQMYTICSAYLCSIILFNYARICTDTLNIYNVLCVLCMCNVCRRAAECKDTYQNIWK